MKPVKFDIWAHIVTPYKKYFLNISERVVIEISKIAPS
jgi:hypothetical protein